MSRCYPYRPSGFIKNGTVGEALIGSIKPSVLKGYSGESKLQREKEQPKADPRKEKKREKKEKRKEKKEKKREKKEKRKERKEKEEKYYNFSDREAEKLNKENCYWDRGGHVKRSEDEETERLEKSSLTDEHNEPVCTQNLCYSSDGTQSSNKRKRDSQPSIGMAVQRTVILIRLPSQKQREANASRSGEQSSSTSGRALEDIVGGQCPKTNNSEGELSAISDSVRKKNIAQYGTQATGWATVYENKIQRKVSKYKALVEDWVPLPLGCEPNDSDDQEWLFGTKKRDGSKRFKSGDDFSVCHTLGLSAHYLPEVDVYALPYSIPL